MCNEFPEKCQQPNHWHTCMAVHMHDKYILMNFYLKFYDTIEIGQLATAKEDKALKMHRDRSLSKLVAMNRRLETQVSQCRVRLVWV